MRKFEVGQLVFSREVMDRLNTSKAFGFFLGDSLGRFTGCDWGDLSEEDKAENDMAVREGGLRIFAAYVFSATGEKVWIITEADRSTTTFLFPHEY